MTIYDTRARAHMLAVYPRALIPGPTGDDQLLHKVHQLDQGSVLAAGPTPLLVLQVSQGSTDPRPCKKKTKN